jgi:hypothetical protein
MSRSRGFVFHCGQLCPDDGPKAGQPIKAYALVAQLPATKLGTPVGARWQTVHRFYVPPAEGQE